MPHDLSTGLGRLKQLRDDLVLLDAMKVKPVTFSMHTWARRHACGTSACAVGYCASLPWARALGLHLQDNWMHRPGFFAPRYGEDVAFDAVASFFQISLDEAFLLFDDGAYEKEDDEEYEPTIQDVVARMNDVISIRSQAAA